MKAQTSLQTETVAGHAIRVRGVVQGVGFRPFVANLATEFGLTGQVWNDAEGVQIELWADQQQLALFTRMLEQRRPPLAVINSIELQPLLKPYPLDGFQIIASQQGITQTGVAADAATCPACLADISDPDNRRYRYPFSNCTHCGPRLSIIRQVPYDRQNTSMAAFKMCPACQMEYEDRHDRRFHAQPNACPECGPRVWLESSSGERLTGDAITAAARAIEEGKVVAIKGLGGFHLACDALNEAAVARLRSRKNRYHKPFALMASDIEQLKMYVDLCEAEQCALQSPQAPVVVLNIRADSQSHGSIAKSVAPDQNTLGFMLPYTPLHHLLMAELDGPIVLTSGNLSDEPQCIDNDEAKSRLEGVADLFLLHDRQIVNRLDDSVVHFTAGKLRLLRRARGYAPAGMLLPPGFEQVDGLLAMGAELKNTFCMISRGQAVVAQHMGDLENSVVLDDYRLNLTLYRQLYDFTPHSVAVDRHPDYFSTQWGMSLASEQGCELIEVQHHHAHLTATMAEHGLPLNGRVLGIVLDGLGMGVDGQLWGGEFLLATYSSFERIATIQETPMIGGAKAMSEPWRNAYAQLHAIGWQEVSDQFAELDLIRSLAQKPLSNIDIMIVRGLNCPMASSTGRLFDAVAAAVGICAETASFEGQAAMALEVAATSVFAHEADAAYPVGVEELAGMPTLIWKPMWIALLRDLQAGVTASRIAARFHHGLIRAVADKGIRLADQHRIKQVVLSGGVFQNRLLLEGVCLRLEEAGLEPLMPESMPANDGGIALGQAVIAAARHLASA